MSRLSFSPSRLLCALAVMLACMFPSCTADDGRYSTSYPCAFSFNTQLHVTSILTRCLDNPGVFVKVDVRRDKGIYVLDLASNNGKETESVPLTTEDENRRIGSVGAGNSLIIGCTNFNGMAAFDAQCPNCLVNYTGSSYPLTWVAGGQAVVCGKCGVSYELNYGGRPSSGERLIEYRIRYDGVRLTVTNN